MKKVFEYSILLHIFLLIVFPQVLFSQNNKETLEVVVNRAIKNGIMKREGNHLIFMAAPGQDTSRIRNYYEGLIKSSGKTYTFQFGNKNSSNPTDATTPAENVIFQNQIPQINTKIKQVVIDQSSVCFAHQTVFGFLHYTDRIENYTWTVPDGVTQVWIEVWSGGGNGFSKFVKNADDPHKLDDITGGGGGGGAYASAMLSVEKGEKFMITIPPGGGGKSVEIVLNERKNVLYLNNGKNGNADDELNGKGYAGVSGGNYGRFTNNVFWVSGQNGSTLTNAYYHYEPPKEFLGQSTAGIEDVNIENFGNGGAAPYLNNGGRGAQLHYTSFAHYADAKNGGFPGGGGGGGVGNSSGFSFGKGAPGLVVVHY